MGSQTSRFTIFCLLAVGVFVGIARAQSPSILWQLPYTSDRAYLSVKFKADSSEVYGGGEYRIGGAGGVIIKRFNATTGAEIASNPVYYGYFGAQEIALSPDGQSIITANRGAVCEPPGTSNCFGAYMKYDSSQLDLLALPSDSLDPNYTVDYSSNGEYIVLGGSWDNYDPNTDYKNLRLVRASDLSLVREMEGHLRGLNNGGTTRARFSPDGTLIGSVGHDSFVKLWRVADGALVRAINFDDAYEVDSIAFSPDGQYVAAARTLVDAQVKVWRVSDGALVKTFNVSPNFTSTTFNKVAWTPDGRYVVAGISFGVGYGENKIKFWNFQSGELALEYSAQEDRFIRDITFSPDGQKFAWAASSQIFVAANPFPAAPLAASKTFCDFDGDRRADVSVFRNGMWYLQQSKDNFRAAQFGTATDKIVPADYDGDGKTDVAVYRGGIWYLQRSNLGFTGISFGDANDVPLPADYDGDGKADLAVFRPSNGTWYLQRSQLGFAGTQFGQAGDKPVPADYDGDGKADIAVNRNGIWYLNRSRLGFTGVQFGDSNDKPIPADYDGDGKTDIAVFRPSNGVWYMLNSTAGFAGFAFGLGTDIPVAADYDGDGKADIAVFRNGTWYLNRTSQGFTGTTFGADGDLPIPARQ